MTRDVPGFIGLEVDRKIGKGMVRDTSKTRLET